MNTLLKEAIKSALEGGKEILEVYNTNFSVETKEDKSPLTEADTKANKKIVAILEKTDIPILSEEGKEIPFSERKNWNRLWIVDPLDGTKEFIKRNGEFTVNIALIENGNPILGVIYVPVRKELYYGEKGIGAFKVENFTSENDLKKAFSIPKKLDRKYTVVASRSHNSPETEEYINELRKKHGEVEMVSMGSSLKICLVAEGVADEYPRFAPTMEWDTAAGHAIAVAAGKELYDRKTNVPMIYNRENLLNNWFLVK